MNKIRILPDQLINRIAAGEVLERPYSAVKELIENSIDAGAKKIDIFIREGGRSEITVSDDGHGIEKNDLERAIYRHATSKLNSMNMEGIKTMGFRGEALSSIASVSDFTLRSNSDSNSEGYEINCVAGDVKKVKPVNQKRGTHVSVKNLFFSTPARLKFLKSENYESLLIKRLIQKFALINFEIQFNLFIDRKKIIGTGFQKNYQKDEKFKIRVREILGDEFLENSVELNKKKEGLRLTGFLGIPTYNYTNSNHQFVYVNKRIITDKSLNTVFRVAYRDLMFHDRFPQLIVHIECPTEWLDINVHPMKNEVRFKDINFLKSFIINSFRSILLADGLNTSNVNSSKIIEKFFHQKEIQKNLVLKTKQKIKSDLYEEQISDRNTDYPDSTEMPLGFAKSQLHENYIISQTKKGIVIVDQHAAHERIVYERLKEDYFKNKIKTQILLIPIVIEVDHIILQDIKEKLNNLGKYGVKVELFGTNSIIIREIPLIVSDSDIKKLVEALIEELVNDEIVESLEAEIEKICSTLACYGSIRSGRELQLEEMNDLLRKMENTSFSSQCNHGRPTYVELDLSEIEKLFGRK